MFKFLSKLFFNTINLSWKFFFKLFFNTICRSSKFFFIPLIFGLISFLFLQDWVDTKLWIKVPFLLKTTFSDTICYYSQYILGSESEITDNKIIFIYFILFWIIAVGVAFHISPFTGTVSLTILACIIVYIVLGYYTKAEWQTTIFHGFGITIERAVDFEDLRIWFENMCLNYYCIEPGMNPCKMARDCIEAHDLEEKLMQDMMAHIWRTTEDYESWAGIADHYVYKIGPRYTKFSEWYWWYDVWPDPATLPKPVEPQNLYGTDPFWRYALAFGAGGIVILGVTQIFLYTLF